MYFPFFLATSVVFIFAFFILLSASSFDASNSSESSSFLFLLFSYVSSHSCNFSETSFISVELKSTSISSGMEWTLLQGLKYSYFFSVTENRLNIQWLFIPIQFVFYLYNYHWYRHTVYLAHIHENSLIKKKQKERLKPSPSWREHFLDNLI